MRVLNLSNMDFANMAHENANSLRAVGVDCVDWSFHRHVFNYESQSEQKTMADVLKQYKNFDVIQIFHSDANIFQAVASHPNKIIYHTGTRYRNNKQRYDSIFKGQRIFTDQCEFILHNKDFTYIAPHYSYVKTEQTERNSKIVVGHFPSNPIVKGTDKIYKMLEPFKDKFEFVISESRLSHQENLNRIARCDIYVELFSPIMNGNPYGCFGVTAFEATALGCLVVTNNVNEAAYQDAYGQHNFVIANDPIKFHNIFNIIENDNFEMIRKEHHKGFFQKHNILAAGTRLKNLL